MGTIFVETSEHVATVTLSAPPMNALNGAMRAELAERIQDFEQDDAIRAIVLRGDGPKAFCAGFDLKELSANLGSKDRSLAQLHGRRAAF